jgi:hypothetical protein
LTLIGRGDDAAHDGEDDEAEDVVDDGGAENDLRLVAPRLAQVP